MNKRPLILVLRDQPDPIHPVDCYIGIGKCFVDIKTPLMPPCLSCVHWKPQDVFVHLSGKDRVFYDGIQLCHAEDMHSDFSCFRERVKDE